MKTFLKLVMSDLRSALIVHLEAKQAVPSDLPALLRHCLDIYDQVGKTHIPELPLELLLVNWCAS